MEPKIQAVNYNLNESEKIFILKKLEKFDTHIKKHVRKFKNYNTKKNMNFLNSTHIFTLIGEKEYI